MMFDVGMGIGSAVGGSVIGIYANSLIGPGLEPTTQEGRYRAWNSTPLLLPPPDQIIRAHFAGVVGEANMRIFLRKHGIPNASSPLAYNGNRHLWDGVIESHRPWPGIPNIRNWFYITGDAALRDEQLDRAGLKNHPFREQMVNANSPITVAEALTLRNREDIDAFELTSILARNGLDRPRDAYLANRLRYQIPYHEDIIRFAVREVFHPDVVSRFNYDAEFPQTFQVWMDKIGAGWKPSDLGYVVPPEQDITWARAYWRAHWQMMSPTQAGHAVHFLRPGPFGDGMSRRPGVAAFTRKDFDTILRIADYPPIIRDWLYGLSFSALTRRDITRMHQTGTLTEKDVLEAWLDLGYDQVNAQRLTDFTVAYAIQAETRFDRQRIETTIRELFDIGVYGADEFVVAMHRVRLKTPAQQAAFAALTTEQQLQAATANPAVMTLLASLRLKKDARFAKKTIAAVRSALIRREITTADGRALLEQAGLDNAEINRLLSLWAVEQAVKPRRVSASQLLNFVKRGAVLPNDAAQELANMGFTNRDIAAMLALAGEDRGIRIAREQERLATSQQQVLRAQAQQLSRMTAERNRIIADLNKSASRPAILKFLQRGYISIEEAYTALRHRGIFPKDAYLWIRDALQTQGEADEKAMETLKAKAEEDSRSTESTSGSSEGLQNGVPQES